MNFGSKFSEQAKHFSQLKATQTTLCLSHSQEPFPCVKVA